MALLSNETKTNIAFKKLVGKAQTSSDRSFFSEDIPSQVSIDTAEVIGNDIPTDPATAVSDGVAEFVEADLQEISASNGLAFNLRFPSGYSGFFAQPGNVDGTPASGGDLIRIYTQVIDQKNNLEDGPASSGNTGGYTYDLRDSTGTPIPAGAEEGWQIDPVAGILASEDPIAELIQGGGTVRLYLYTGRFLDEILGNLQTGQISAPGSDNQVLFNDNGTLGANTEFTFNGTRISVPNVQLSSNNTTTSAGNFQVRKDSDGFLATVEDPGNLEARYEGSSAFTFGRRVGTTTGGFSVVLGEDNEASGQGAIAVGSNTTASGDAAFSAGDSTTASENHATALGVSTTASGPQSLAVGNNSTASGTTSFAAGDSTEATGNFSVVFGRDAKAIGDTSLAFGRGFSTGEGFADQDDFVIASEQLSFAFGFRSRARWFNSFVVGSYNEDPGENPENAGLADAGFERISADSKIFQVGVGDDGSGGGTSFGTFDGRGEVDGLYTTYRDGTYVRHGLQLDAYNSGTSSYERVLRFGSSIDETTNGEDIQLLARDPTDNNIVEYITADDLINQEVNVVGGTNINTSFDTGTDEYTVSTVVNPEFSGMVLFSPDATAYQVTVTNDGNLRTSLTSGGLGQTAADVTRLNYDGETLSVEADMGQTAPLFQGFESGTNPDSVFEVAPTGTLTQSSGEISTGGDNVIRRYELNQRTTDGTQAVLQIDSQDLAALPTVATESSWQFLGHVVARVESSTASATQGDTHVWEFEGVISRSGGSSRFIGQPSITTVATDSSVSGYSLSTNLNSNSLEIQVTGGSSDTVNWNASLETVELAT